MAYIILLFLLSYLFLAIKRQDWAFGLLLFLLPTYQIRFDILGIPFTMLEGMILILFGVWFAGNWKHIFENLIFKINNCLKITNYKLQIPARYPFDIEIIIFLLVSLIALFVSHWSDSALGIWKAYIFEPILVFLLIFNIRPDRTVFKRIQNIVFPLALSALVVSLITMLQKAGIVFTPANFWPRVTGPFPYPNAVGLYVGPLIPLTLGFLYYFLGELKTRQKTILDSIVLLVLPLSIVFSLTALILASSEGAAVGVIAAFFVIAVFYLARITKKKLIFRINYAFISAIIVFAIFSSWFFLYVVPEHKYFNFEKGTFNYLTDKLMLKDFSGEVRKQQWRETIELLSQNNNWLFGVGLSGYQAAVKPYHQEGIFFNNERDEEFRTKIVWFDEQYKAKHWRPVEIYMYPHNLVLNFWVEFGAPGVLLFLWIIIKCIRSLLSGIKQGSNFALGLLGAFIVVIIHGLVDVPYFKNDLSVMFWVMAGLTGALNLQVQNNRMPFLG